MFNLLTVALKMRMQGLYPLFNVSIANEYEKIFAELDTQKHFQKRASFKRLLLMIYNEEAELLKSDKYDVMVFAGGAIDLSIASCLNF